MSDAGSDDGEAGGTGGWVQQTNTQRLVKELGDTRKLQTISTADLKLLLIKLLRNELNKDEHGLSVQVKTDILLNFSQHLAKLFPGVKE